MRALSYLQTGLHTATKPWRFIEQHPVLLLAALLILVGTSFRYHTTHIWLD